MKVVDRIVAAEIEMGVNRIRCPDVDGLYDVRRSVQIVKNDFEI